MTAYREAVVTFIDILGFADIVEHRTAAEVDDILKQITRIGGGREDDEEAHTIAFSDSIVRVRFLDGHFRDSAIWWETHDVVFLQGELANDGIWLRGGVAVGDVYCDGEKIFGPALTRAYRLESEFANVPRVIVDPGVLTKVKSDETLRHNLLEQELAYYRQLLRQDSDGLYFVDYLRSFYAEMDHPETYPDYLSDVRSKIISSFSKPSQVSRTHQKLMWLARYFNGVVESSLPRLVISENEIPFLEPL